MHCGRFSSTLASAHLLSVAPPPSCDNHKHLHTLSNVPLGQHHPQENTVLCFGATLRVCHSDGREVGWVVQALLWGLGLPPLERHPQGLQAGSSRAPPCMWPFLIVVSFAIPLSQFLNFQVCKPHKTRAGLCQGASVLRTTLSLSHALAAQCHGSARAERGGDC